MRRFLCVWSLVPCLAFPVVAQACIEGSGRQLLFVGPPPEVAAPLVVVEGVVVEYRMDEITFRLIKPIKGIPAGTEITLRASSRHCGHKWGGEQGEEVFAVGGFNSFRLPHPEFEAVPLKGQRTRSTDWRKYLVDPDYVRKLEGKPAK